MAYRESSYWYNTVTSTADTATLWLTGNPRIGTIEPPSRRLAQLLWLTGNPRIGTILELLRTAS